jgi:rare lipoprotein A (peptidoglycan hydrolase)
MMTRKKAPLGLVTPVLLVMMISPKGTHPASAEEANSYRIVRTGTMVASFYGYGDRFHGRETANGERFDRNAPTAAHKFLPFGTILVVTNPENGRWTRVRINDRGPYIRGRDLDLSYGAARKLGMVEEGVRRIEYLELVPQRRQKK